MNDPVAGHADVTNLRAECEQLRERMRLLEDRHDLDQRSLAELEHYRRALYRLVQRMVNDEDIRFTAEELRDLLAGKDCLPLHAFIHDLEKIAGS